MTIFLGVTNFLEVIFWLRVIVFLAEVAFFARNIYVKGAGTEDASIEVTGIRAACIKDIYIEDTSNCTGGIFIEP